MRGGTSEYAAQLTAALDHPDPIDAVARVKSVVIQEIKSLDPSAKIHATEYFNHTYIPDLVLSWPRQPGEDREIFLRLTDDLPYLADGIERLDRHQKPVIFGMANFAVETVGRNDLAATAKRLGSLVADPDAISSLVAATKTSPMVGLMATALTQGGRGLVDAARADEVSRAVATGFDGARQTSAGPTARATRVLADVLDTTRSGRMIRFLQAIWVGSGGRLDLFPDATEFGGDIAADALEYLLGFAEITDDSFWRSIGKHITLASIAQLRVPEYSENLQRLMKSNLDRLWCRGCAVSPDQVSLGMPVGGLHWTIEKGLVTLRANGFAAHVSEYGEEVKKRRITKPRSGLTVGELRSRAKDSILDSLTMSDGVNEVTLNSELHEDVVQGERLRNLAASFGGELRVQKAQAPLPSGQRISLDFKYSTAAGVTSGKPLVADVLGVALPIIEGLDDELRDQLTELLTLPEGIGDEQLVFGFDEAE